VTFGALEDEVAGASRGAVARLLVSAFGLAACVTAIFLSMRAVMDIGGACASGGPYVPVRPCPDGVPALMTIGMLGLFGFGGLGLWAGAQVGRGWAALPLLAWPALFISLGWNFLEYGIRPPGGPSGTEIGWLICGVVFVATGAIPLAIAIAARHELRSEGAAAVARRYRMNLPRQPPPSRSGVNDLDRLERLADLHRAGDLTDDEYAAAKRRLLGIDS
jgi:putative oligomerization/nucleic acid binding protein